MHIRDLITLVLKIYGVSILLFDVLPMLISNMGVLPNAFRFGETTMIIYGLGLIILPLIVALALIFASSWIISRLKLDKGFNSNDVKVSSSSSDQLLQLALIFLGGFLIVDNLSSTIAKIVEAFKISLYGFGSESGYPNLWKNGLSLFIGALLIANREFLADWLKPKTKIQD